MYPRMIPRLSRAGFNVLAGSAPESRGRQPSSHQTSLYTYTRIYTGRVYVYTRVYTRANTLNTYTLNTRARDTYLLRSTELHVRARALLPTHPHLFSFVCARTGRREGSVHVVEEEGRNVSNAHEETRVVGWLVRLARVCFTRTIRRYCYFCDQALSIPSPPLRPPRPFRFVFF